MSMILQRLHQGISRICPDMFELWSTQCNDFGQPIRRGNRFFMAHISLNLALGNWQQNMDRTLVPSTIFWIFYVHFCWV